MRATQRRDQGSEQATAAPARLHGRSGGQHRGTGGQEQGAAQAPRCKWQTNEFPDIDAPCLQETSSDACNLKRKCDALAKELGTMKSEETKYLEQIAHIKSQNEHLTKVKVRQNLQVLSLKTNLEHLNTLHNSTCNKLAKITVDLEYTVQERDKNKRALTQRINLLKVREDELIKQRQETAKLAKSQETIARKYGGLEMSKQEVEQENMRLK